MILGAVAVALYRVTVFHLLKGGLDPNPAVVDLLAHRSPHTFTLSSFFAQPSSFATPK
jgi:hypothetical protein